MLVSVALLCCFSSYSFAQVTYTPQYPVGGTGPNGGTVTQNDVTSVITSQETTINGGFEEVTTVHTFTESIIEAVQNEVVTSQQTQVLTTTTTPNMLANPGFESNRNTTNPTSWTRTGSVYVCDACGPYGGNALKTGNQLTGGGTVTQTFNIENFMTEAEAQLGFTLNYGADVKSHSSNTSVPACAGNYSSSGGDCRDDFKITVKLQDGSTQVALYEHEYLGITWKGWDTTTFDFTQSVGANSWTDLSATMSLYGIDRGYNSGYFGPYFDNVHFSATYSAISFITEQVTTLVTNNINSIITAQLTDTQSTFLGLPDDTTSAPITTLTQQVQEPETIEVEIADANGDPSVTLEFTVEVEPETQTVNVEMTSIDAGGVATIETIAEVPLVESFSSITPDAPEVQTVEVAVETQVAEAVDTAIADIEVDVNTPEVASVEPTTESTPEVASVEPTTEETSTSTVEVEAETTEVASTEGDSNETTETVSEPSGDVEESVADSGESTSTDEGASDSKNSDKSGSDSKSKTKVAKKETKEQRAKRIEKKVKEAKQKIVKRILSAMTESYNISNETTKIALMAALTDQANFRAYQKQNNIDLAEWYDDKAINHDLPQLLDPAAFLYNMAQDKIMNEMIDQQYK